MDETMVEKHFSDSERVALYTHVTPQVATWLNKVAEIGISKQSMVDYAFRNVMAMPIKEVLATLLMPKAEAVGLVEKSNDESPASEGVSE